MRTEEEILKDFEKLGYTEIYVNKPYFIEMEKDQVRLIVNMAEDKSVDKFYENGLEDRAESITLEELKLLYELFKLWGWL